MWLELGTKYLLVTGVILLLLLSFIQPFRNIVNNGSLGSLKVEKKGYIDEDEDEACCGAKTQWWLPAKISQDKQGREESPRKRSWLGA